MHAPLLTYAQLRPHAIESNRFAYHLDQLVKTGLIAKHAEGYKLTTAGMAYADRVSHETMTVRKQPHIVTTICITNGHNQTLLFRHTFQPYLGLVGFPQGRIHYGETIAEAATRELFEKSGLRDLALIHRGMAYITATREGEDISRLLTHVFSGTVDGAPQLSCVDPSKGVSLWAEAADYTAAQCMPGFWQIEKMLAESEGLFFAELTCEMEPDQTV